MKYLSALLFVTVFAICGAAQCDSTCGLDEICCKKNPIPAGVMISNVHSKGEWMFSYRHSRMFMDNVVDVNSNSIGIDEQLNSYSVASLNMQMRMQMLMGMYGVNDKLTVMLMLHYMNNEMRMLMPGSESFHIHTMRTGGLSDSKISFLYSFIKKSNEQLILALGSTIPGGSISQKGKSSSMMYPNQRYPYMMQLGSGTFDPLITLNYVKSINRFYFSSQVNIVMRAYKNSIGYKLGNEYAFNNWAAWQMIKPISVSLRMESTLNENIKGKDSELNLKKEVSASTSNSGGFKNILFTGFTFQPVIRTFNDLRLAFEFGLPIYEKLNGWQQRNAASMAISINYNFN